MMEKIIKQANKHMRRDEALKILYAIASYLKAKGWAVLVDDEDEQFPGLAAAPPPDKIRFSISGKHRWDDLSPEMKTLLTNPADLPLEAEVRTCEIPYNRKLFTAMIS